MAQTTRPQNPWPPQQNQAFEPPAKRQRMSPGPASSPYAHASTPYASSPTYNNISLPQGAFNNARTNGVHPSNADTKPVQGVMGPPQRPIDRNAEKPGQKDDMLKAVDVNDLQDVFSSSGVNLKDEEDFLNRSYGSSFQRTNAPSAFSGVPSNAGYDLLSRNTFGNVGDQRSSFQQQRPIKSEEEELVEKHRSAARAINEGQQWHLNDPFLWGASLRQRMQSIAKEHALSIPIDGLFDRIAEKQPTAMAGQRMQGQDGAGVQAVKAPSMLNKDTPMEPMLTLLSLSTKERLRTLLEDAYGMARARQLGSDGVVPPEWADVVVGEEGEPTMTKAESVTGTVWEGIKRSHSAIEGENNKSQETPEESQPTKSFTKHPVNNALAALIAADRQREVERLAKRAARRRKRAERAAVAATASTPQSPTDTGTPAPEVSIAPLAQKQTKKERETAAKKERNMTEESQTQSANVAANLALGGKKYAWMSKIGAGKQAPKQTPGKPGAVPAVQKKKEGVDAIVDRKYGSWREDGVGGKGVQLRDWIGVLEMDGRERKTLQWAYTKLEAGPQEPDKDRSQANTATNQNSTIERRGSQPSPMTTQQSPVQPQQPQQQPPPPARQILQQPMVQPQQQSRSPMPQPQDHPPTPQLPPNSSPQQPQQNRYEYQHQNQQAQRPQQNGGAR